MMIYSVIYVAKIWNKIFFYLTKNISILGIFRKKVQFGFLKLIPLDFDLQYFTFYSVGSRLER